jgi:hypothetical protein
MTVRFATSTSNWHLAVTKTGETAANPDRWVIPLSKDGELPARAEPRHAAVSSSTGRAGAVGTTGCPTRGTTWSARFSRGTNVAGTHTVDLFVDGVKVATRDAGGSPAGNTVPLMLGSSAPTNGLGRFGGAMDEVRVARAARSDAWIRTAYDQQADPVAFLAVGPEEPGTVYAYQKTLTIQGAKIAGDLVDFPVLVTLHDADLRTVAEGGRVRSAQGWDIGFTLPDGTPWITRSSGTRSTAALSRGSGCRH